MTMRRTLPTLPLILCCMAALVALTTPVKAGVQAGLILCYTAIIPSVFPFAVLSGCIAFSPTGRQGWFGRLFHRVFRLPAEAATPFLVGILCGFPMGGRAVARGYLQGVFSREEAERMLCFTSNTSIAFLIGGVGVSLRGSLREGIWLFGVQTLLALLCALLTVPKNSPSHVAPLPSHFPPAPTLAHAVQGGINATLTVCGFVTFFSACLALLRPFCSSYSFAIIASLLEVGNACQSGAALPLPLTAFAVCFSGLSVHLQTVTVLEGTDLSVKPYLLSKMLQGLAAAAIFGCLSYFRLL